MKALFLTKYGTLGASSRYRTFQYLPYLKAHGVEVTVSSLFDNDYLTRLYAGESVSPLRLVAYYAARLQALRKSASYDLVWLEKELLPWLPFFFEAPLLARLKPLVIDYDDAIFHNYDHHRFTPVRAALGRKIDQVMGSADLVIAGNDYLAARAVAAGAAAVETVPTVIDLDRYPVRLTESAGRFTIGWIGSPTATRHIKTIEPALRRFCSDGKSLVRIVGGADLSLPGIPVEILPWSEQTEHELMNTFDVGIMPLPDSPWERGKCGFKLIQYMACGLPVIASPVGVNSQLVENGVNGFLASGEADWVDALQKLRDDAQLRFTMGQAGRRKVESTYCLQVTAPILLNLLRGVTAGELHTMKRTSI